MNTDRMLAWVGVAIGLLGLIPIFRDASVQVRVAYGVGLLLLVILFIVLYRSGKGPQYSTLTMKKTLKIQTADGSRATLVREQRIRINFGSMGEIWCRNLVADGRIENLRIDGNIPEAADQERLGCLLDVRKRFLRTLYRGDEESVTWSYDLVDCFSESREFMDHEVTPGTRSIELVVELPDRRPCRNACLEEKVAGEPSRQLGDPSIERNGTVIRAQVKSPNQGRTIRLSWEW